MASLSASERHRTLSTMEQAARELNALIPDNALAAMTMAGRSPHASQLGPGAATGAHMPIVPHGSPKAKMTMRTNAHPAALRTSLRRCHAMEPHAKNGMGIGAQTLQSGKRAERLSGKLWLDGPKVCPSQPHAVPNRACAIAPKLELFRLNVKPLGSTQDFQVAVHLLDVLGIWATKIRSSANAKWLHLCDTSAHILGLRSSLPATSESRHTPLPFRCHSRRNGAIQLDVLQRRALGRSLYTGTGPQTPANPNQCGANGCPHMSFVFANAPAGPLLSCKICHGSGYCMDPKASAKSSVKNESCSPRSAVFLAISRAVRMWACSIPPCSPPAASHLCSY